MTIQFLRVVESSALVGQPNGKLGGCNLVPAEVAGIGHLSLEPNAERAWHAMCGMLWLQTGGMNGGHVLSATGMYRPFEVQESEFVARMTPPPFNPAVHVSPPITRPRSLTDGTLWYLRLHCLACATPGTSNHGKGRAIDVASFINGIRLHISRDPVAWQWLVDHAVEYGFCWEGARPGTPGWEMHHLVYFAGDAIPAAVIEFDQHFPRNAA